MLTYWCWSLMGGMASWIPTRERQSRTLEYLTARQKGIPIYSFVEQGLERLIPVWRQNPSVNLSPQVENPKVLEFIDQIRNIDREWMQEFRTPYDVMGMLRTQFAYQHERGLRLTHQLRTFKGATQRG
jgi:hypothetical protein